MFEWHNSTMAFVTLGLSRLPLRMLFLILPLKSLYHCSPDIYLFPIRCCRVFSSERLTIALVARVGHVPDAFFDRPLLYFPPFFFPP